MNYPFLSVSLKRTDKTTEDTGKMSIKNKKWAILIRHCIHIRLNKRNTKFKEKYKSVNI